MVPPASQSTTALAAYVAELRRNPLTRHIFQEPSRFRAILDLSFVVVDMNDCRSVGLVPSRDDLVGHAFWMVGVYGTDAAWEQRWRSRFAQAIESRGTITYDDEFESDEDGSLGVRGELSVVTDDAGEPVGYFIDVCDIDIVRETKAELARQVAMRKLIFDQTFQLTALLAPDGTVVEVNRAVERIGLPRAAFLGQRLQDLGLTEPNGEARAQQWQERINLMQTAQEPLRCFDVLTDERGAFLRAVDCSMTPVRDERGTLELILLELRDQTEHYTTQLGLRASEERFRGLAEALPQMVWTATPDGGVDYFSARWEEFTGRPLGELVGRGFLDLIHPDDQDTVTGAGARGVRSDEPMIFRMKNADGRYRWMEARMDSVLDDSGAVVRTFGGTFDITERREAEDAARRRQEQLRATLELTGYGTYVWYVAEDRFSEDSYQLEEILGLPMADMMAGNAFELFMASLHPEDVAMVSASVLGAIVPSGPDYEAEFRMIVPERDGGPGTEERWVSAIGRAEFDDRGQPIRLVGVFADITGRRHEDDARLRLQKIEAMGTLASGIAHDFNNVIGAILSYAHVAEAELNAGESPAASIGEIARGARRAGDIVQRMLTFSREEAPRQVAFDLGDVVTEARSLVRPTVGAAIELVERIQPDLPGMLGDPTQLHQVVVNLLTNAAQAIGDDPGRVELTVDTAYIEEGLPGAGGLPVAGDYLRLRVSDDGPGMPDAILRRVFDPFFTTKGPQQGTGLGLSAVHSIIANHGGRVDVESRLGEGTQFTCLLPIRELQPEPAAEPIPEFTGDTALLRILFVDDEEALVRLAHRALPYRGCVVTGFTDPVEALNAFERARDDFDAMITDLSMPGMTGLQLADHVRSLRADIPIVLTSGYMRAEEHSDATRRGVDAVVPKPCSIDDLADTVQELIAARASAAG